MIDLDKAHTKRRLLYIKLRRTLVKCLILPDHFRHLLPQKSHVILKDYQVAYLSIPKVACSSIKYALAGLIFGRELDPFGQDKTLRIHEDVFIGRSLKSIARKYDDYFKFTFVRNPWDRLVSCYNDKILNPDRRTPKMIHQGFEAGMTFAAFIERVCHVPDEEADEHICSQIGRIAYQGRCLPDFVGRFETLTEDWQQLRTILAPRLDRALPDLPCVNKMPHLPYQRYYDRRLKNMVQERYKYDIEWFNYQFE